MAPLHHRVQLILALAAMMWLLIFLAIAHASERVVITTDHGGNVAEYAARVILYTQRGAEVEIRGTCNSACTQYLAVPGVCVAPTAWLGFHSSSGTVAGKLGDDLTAATNMMLMATYPKAVREMLRPLTSDLQYLRGAAIIRSGAVRACAS